jgi:hypothetical protein
MICDHSRESHFKILTKGQESYYNGVTRGILNQIKNLAEIGQKKHFTAYKFSHDRTELKLIVYSPYVKYAEEGAKQNPTVV